MLAHQQGKEAMEKLRQQGEDLEDLERWFMEEKELKMMEKIRIKGVETEDMQEEDLRQMVEMWDSGPKVEKVFNVETGRWEYYVMMLGTKPDQQMTKETEVKMKEEDEEGKGEEPSEYEKERLKLLRKKMEEKVKDEELLKKKWKKKERLEEWRGREKKMKRNRMKRMMKSEKAPKQKSKRKSRKRPKKEHDPRAHHAKPCPAETALIMKILGSSYKFKTAKEKKQRKETSAKKV